MVCLESVIQIKRTNIKKELRAALKTMASQLYLLLWNANKEIHNQRIPAAKATFLWNE